MARNLQVITYCPRYAVSRLLLYYVKRCNSENTVSALETTGSATVSKQLRMNTNTIELNVRKILKCDLKIKSMLEF